MAEAPAFVVSARKYRPSTFNMVVGQGHITTTLRNAINQNQLAQAFLFTGPRGVGKTTCARILAKAINCLERGPDAEPCNRCSSCQAFNNSASFNITELDAASNNSVEDIRALVEQVRYPPHSGKYKVYIIDEVHMLSTSAFNAFLKTLEEPPSYAIFILATTEKHKILPTILSRCQIFDFARIRIVDIVQQLRFVADSEHIAAEDAALHVIGQKADGGMRDALSMFDLVSTFAPDRAVTYAGAVEHLNVLDFDYYFKVVQFAYSQDAAKVLLLFDEILRKGFDGHLFITGLAEHLRNVLVSRDAQTVALLQVAETAQPRFLEQAKAIPAGYLMTALNLASVADGQYKNTRNQRLLVELALLKMCYLQQAIDVATGTQGANASTPAAPAAGQKKNDASLTEPAPAILADPPRMPPYGTPPQRATPNLRQAPSKQMQTLVVEAPPPTWEEEALPTPSQNAAITDTSLARAWAALTEQLRTEGRMKDVGTLAATTPTPLDESIIRLATPHRIADEALQAFMPSIRPRLNALLQNTAYQIEYAIEQPTIASGIDLYTDNDKLAYLLQTYPNLQNVKAALGLDLL